MELDLKDPLGRHPLLEDFFYSESFFTTTLTSWLQRFVVRSVIFLFIYEFSQIFKALILCFKNESW